MVLCLLLGQIWFVLTVIIMILTAIVFIVNVFKDIMDPVGIVVGGFISIAIVTIVLVMIQIGINLF